MKPRSVIAGAIVGLVVLCAISAMAYSQVAQGAVQQAASASTNTFNVMGLAVDSNGSDLSGADVKLHVMSYTPNGAKELYNVTVKTSGQPYPGRYHIDNITVPAGAPIGEAYCYLDSSGKGQGTTLCGRSDDFVPRAGTFIKDIVLNPPGHANESSVMGFAVNSCGMPLAGQKVTLHVMGYNATTGMPMEIYSRTTATAGEPNAGLYLFDYVRMPHGAVYTYASMNVTKNGTTYNGKSSNYSMEANGTTTNSIIVRMPFDTYKVQGYVVDSIAVPQTGVNVTLHVMGYDGTATVLKELGHWQETTSGQPDAGHYAFNLCAMPSGATFLYASTNVTKNGTTYYARGYNYTITPNMSVTSNLVVRTPFDTYKVQGYVVDSTAIALPGVNVTLHIMGYNETTMASKELRTYLETTSGQPDAGHYAFNLSMMPAGAKYLYTSANVTRNGTTYYGAGNNISITPNMSVTSGIVVKLPRDTCTVKGYVVNSTGIGLPGLNVTLHVMGYNATTMVPKEFYSRTAITGNSPYAGEFIFGQVNIPAGATYAYTDTSITENETAYYGRSDNATIAPGADVTESIILKVPASA